MVGTQVMATQFSGKAGLAVGTTSSINIYFLARLFLNDTSTGLQQTLCRKFFCFATPRQEKVAKETAGRVDTHVIASFLLRYNMGTYHKFRKRFTILVSVLHKDRERVDVILFLHALNTSS